MTIQIIIVKDANNQNQPFYAVYDGVANSWASSPAPRTQLPLDQNQITNGGTAVTVINAGNRSAGGVLQTNDPDGLFVNEIGEAGTVVGLGTIFIASDTVWRVTPGSGPVSVNSVNSGVVVSGFGMQ